MNRKEGMTMASEEQRLKKAHVALMKHRDTALYAGVMLMGSSQVIDDDNITAYTDGFNKKYGRKFMSTLNDEELRALVLHENLHVALKHIPRFTKEFKENAQLVNASADFVVNDIITHIDDRSFLQLPKGGLVHEKFHNWSVREVYNYLKDEMDKQQKDKDSPNGEQGNDEVNIDGKSLKLEPIDEHDFENAKDMTTEQKKELSEKIDRALREGGILAGRMGAKVPRTIQDLLEPKVNWRHVLREFITQCFRGADEYTWRKFNKRHVANDIYLPSMENENIGDLIIAIDTSGSIGQEELTEFASELASICNVCVPSKVRVLWWDTEVHGEQVFDGNYNNIKDILKPQGGGGTDPQCIEQYVKENKINAEACIVFTDGYFGEPETWDLGCETLWGVTEYKQFTTRHGKVVHIREN